MASAAEQLAANVNWGAFSKADELKKRIWFTLGALFIYPARHLRSDSPASIRRHSRPSFTSHISKAFLNSSTCFRVEPCSAWRSSR